jgi:hypothetical protein
MKTLAINTFLEFYDDQLTTDLHQEMIKTIQENKAKMIQRASKTRCIYEVVIQNDTFKLVYSKKSKMVIKFLPNLENSIFDYKITKHAKERLMERHGVLLTPSLNRKIVDSIKTKKSKYLVKLSKSRSVQMVTVESTNYYLIYSHLHNIIVTFLNKSWIRYNEESESYEYLKIWESRKSLSKFRKTS